MVWKEAVTAQLRYALDPGTYLETVTETTENLNLTFM